MELALAQLSSTTSLDSDSICNTINIDAGDETHNDQGPLENNQIELHTPETASMLSGQSQVLSNADLLQSILSFFHVPLEGADVTPRIPAPASQHLLWASLTCNAFFHPAMNVLWRSMDSWLPLLRLIPAFPRDGNITTMAGVILEQDLQRLHLYGRRIRRLDFRPLTHLVSPYIYTHISQVCHSHLFPALKELIISNIGGIADENLAGLFLTPSTSLSKLSIGAIAPFNESVAVSLLQNVYMKAKTLRELALAGQFTSTTSSLSLVNRFTKLETLRIDGRHTAVPGNILDRCSELMCLKSLFIVLDRWSSLVPSSPTVLPFEALHDLYISASASHVLVILQCIAAQYLKRVRLHFTSLGQGASEEILGQCIQRITLMTKATQTLKTIDINSANAYVRIPFAELKWLVQTQISHIDLSVGRISFPLTQDLLSGKSWQSLEYLVLRSGKANKPQGATGARAPTSPSRLSIFSLLQFLAFLPNLKYLATSVTLRMEADDINAMRTKTQSRVTCHNLQELALLPFVGSPKVLKNPASATVENAFVLSCYIKHFCPHLRNLDLSKINEVDSNWRKGVEVMVKGLEERNKGHVCQVEG